MARAEEKSPDLRASDAERDAVASELGQHFQDGRLDRAEFDERVGAAIAAKTQRELLSLLADLPQGQVAQRGEAISEPEHVGATGGGPWRSASPRLTRGRPAILAVLPLLVAVAVFAGLFSGGWQHGWPFAPFGFLWLIVPILVIRTRVLHGGRRQWH